MVAADGPEASAALRRAPRTARRAARRPRGQAAPRRTDRRATRRPRPTRVAFDTQIAAYILNASLRSQSIADVCAERLDLILPPAAAGLPPTPAPASRRSARSPFAPSSRNSWRAKSLDRLYGEIELPLIPVLARMEATRRRARPRGAGLLEREFGDEIHRLEQEIWHDVGHEFNLGSPKQLEQVLFYELNLPKGKRTKTGYSTDASVLEDLRPAHPIIGEAARLARLHEAALDLRRGAADALSDVDGRLHTTFHQAVAATGRLSSRTRTCRTSRSAPSSAGGSGAPSSRAIRPMTLLAADYSQIELRILAHVSGDEHLKAAFAAGEDIHRATAARVLHKAPDDVTKDERSMAKMVNFGLAYGMSDFGLSSRAPGSPARKRRSSSTPTSRAIPASATT